MCSRCAHFPEHACQNAFCYFVVEFNAPAVHLLLMMMTTVIIGTDFRLFCSECMCYTFAWMKCVGHFAKSLFRTSWRTLNGQFHAKKPVVDNNNLSHNSRRVIHSIINRSVILSTHWEIIHWIHEKKCSSPC